MHWKLLEYFNKNNISFYLAYPKLDSGDVLKQRCIDKYRRMGSSNKR